MRMEAGSVPVALAVLVLGLAACRPTGQVRRPPVQDDTGEPDTSESDTDTDTDTDDTQTPTVLHVAAIADMNGSYGSTNYGAPVHAAVAALVADPPDLVLSLGDMVAGQQSGLDYEAMWDGFHAAVSDPLAAAGIPLAVTPGNHDASGYSAYAAERELFVAEWQARRPDVTFVDDTHYPLRYAFVVEDVLFVSLDATTVGALSSDQRVWLDGVLDVPAWARIVYGHIPIVPFGTGVETEVLGDLELESMLADHDVDLYLSGHHHAWYPGRREGVHEISAACLGSGPRALVGEDEVSPRSLLRITVADGGVTVDAYGGEAFDEVLSRDSLPASLNAGVQRIDRDDLVR